MNCLGFEGMSSVTARSAPYIRSAMLTIVIASAGCATVAGRSNQTASEDGFIGTHQGGITIDHSSMVLRLRCESESMCEMDTVSSDGKRKPAAHIDYFSAAAPVVDLAQVKYALKYARDRRSNPSASKEDSALITQLRSLLDSEADIERCLDLNSKERGYLVVCKIKNSPWRGSTILLFGSLLANCGPSFCRYVIYPLFGR